MPQDSKRGASAMSSKNNPAAVFNKMVAKMPTSTSSSPGENFVDSGESEELSDQDERVARNKRQRQLNGARNREKKRKQKRRSKSASKSGRVKSEDSDTPEAADINFPVFLWPFSAPLLQEKLVAYPKNE